VSWEEVASLAVEALWNDIEPIVRPVVGLLAQTSSGLTAPSAESPSRCEPTRSVDPPAERQHLWLSAEETAALLNTTAHTLRRLAREERCPVLVRRIGGRWRFARVDVERFVAG
jgi:excisionase family DNA binding protein